MDPLAMPANLQKKERILSYNIRIKFNKVWSFYSTVAEDFIFLGYNVVSMDNWIPKHQKKKIFLDIPNFKDENNM